MTINRLAAAAMLRLAAQFPAIGITGPRQTGKSTIARSVFPDKKYVTFDDKNLRDFASSNPNDFVAAFPDGAIFDEAQKVPEIFDALKLHIDAGNWTPGKFILTGSSQFRLKKNMSDSMAGRVAFLTLLPFSMGELAGENLLSSMPYLQILQGNYPPLYDKTKQFIAADWYQNYIESYIEKDVNDLINPSNSATFKKFIQICAIYSGQMLSMENIAKELGISAPTVKSWLSILENSYIIHFLYPHSNNLGKSIVKTAKMYFIDTGLLCHLLKIQTVEDLLLSRYKGAIVETFAIAELLKQRLNQGKKTDLYFFRDKYGFEVDALADWETPFAIEIKSTSQTENKMSANVRKYAKLAENKVNTAVFYLGTLTLTINNNLYLAWKDWANFANIAEKRI
ncbi:MAG: ATP-binding protein [Cardiobacteriaceae bacterium]|nr:ATP-binding protein [Cardiobacteriaceae bacterium]